MLMTISHPFVATYTLRVNRFGSSNPPHLQEWRYSHRTACLFKQIRFPPGAMMEAYPFVLH